MQMREAVFLGARLQIIAPQLLTRRGEMERDINGDQCKHREIETETKKERYAEADADRGQTKSQT